MPRRRALNAAGHRSRKSVHGSREHLGLIASLDSLFGRALGSKGACERRYAYRRHHIRSMIFCQMTWNPEAMSHINVSYFCRIPKTSGGSMSPEKSTELFHRQVRGG